MFLKWEIIKQTTNDFQGQRWEGTSLYPDSLGQLIHDEIKRLHPLNSKIAIDGISSRIYFTFFSNLLFQCIRTNERTFIQSIPLEHFRDYLKKYEDLKYMDFYDAEDGEDETDSDTDSDPLSQGSLMSQCSNDYDYIIVMVPEVDWNQSGETLNVQLVYLLNDDGNSSCSEN